MVVQLSGPPLATASKAGAGAAAALGGPGRLKRDGEDVSFMDVT